MSVVGAVAGDRHVEDFAGRVAAADSEAEQVACLARWVLAEFDAYY